MAQRGAPIQSLMQPQVARRHRTLGQLPGSLQELLDSFEEYQPGPFRLDLQEAERVGAQPVALATLVPLAQGTRSA